jgi:hypothetical protein
MQPLIQTLKTQNTVIYFYDYVHLYWNDQTHTETWTRLPRDREHTLGLGSDPTYNGGVEWSVLLLKLRSSFDYDTVA